MILSAIAFALVLGIFIFVVLPRGRVWQRTASVSLYVVLLGMVYVGSTELMSRPKPMRLEWRNPEQATVIAANLRENEAIYVWLAIEGQDEPRAYALPWNQETAQQLQQAMAQAQDGGTDLMMSMPSESGMDDREPKFYAAPQPAMPEKDYSDTGAEGPMIYEQPASGG
jgi:hypothetical protein